MPKSNASPARARKRLKRFKVALRGLPAQPVVVTVLARGVSRRHARRNALLGQLVRCPGYSWEVEA